jgi:hypothetical protein
MKENREQGLTLTPYLALSRDLSALLIPVALDDQFRAELYHSLVDRARRQQFQPSLLPLTEADPETGISRRVVRWVSTVPGQDRRWVWGAAAVGSAVSLAGLVTYVWHRRGNRAA